VSMDAGPMGAIIGAAVAIGATTTSTSIGPTISTSINGSITPIIAAAWHVANATALVEEGRRSEFSTD
jgi:hypothetical protein